MTVETITLADLERLGLNRHTAWLHGIDCFEYADRLGVPRLETCARPGRTRSRRAQFDAGVRDLAEDDVEEVDGVPTYRLDFAWPQRRVCLEYDGLEAHDSPEQRRDDQARRAWLREHGWTVIVVRIGDFSPQRVEAWLAEVWAALRPTYDNRRW